MYRGEKMFRGETTKMFRSGKMFRGGIISLRIFFKENSEKVGGVEMFL